MTVLEALLRRIPGSTAVRGIGLIAAATAVGQGLALAFSPVLSRVYSPADFGLAGVFVALVSILSVIGTLRYELAIPLPKNDSSAMDLLVLGLGANVAIIGILALCVPLFGDAVAASTGAPQLGGYLWLLAPTLLATGAYQLLSAWAVRRRQYGLLSRRTVSYSLAQIGSTVGLGLAGVGPVGLMLGTGAAQGAGSLAVAHAVLRNDRAALRTVSVPGMWRMARRYVRFPLLSSWSGLVSSAGIVVPVLLLSRYYGPTVAGWFSLTIRVVGAPMTLLGEAIAQVFLGEAANVARHEPRALRRMYVVSCGRLFAVGLLPILLIAGPAPLWFPIVFGSRWHEAGRYAVWLVPLYLAQFVASPLSSTLDVLERQGIELAWNCLRLILAVASIVAPWKFGVSALGTVAIYGFAMGAVYLVLMWWTYRELCRLPSREGPSAGV